MMLTLFLLLLNLLSIQTSLAWTKREDPHGKTIIAYYASWQWYDRDGLAKPSNLDHSKVTRYNFAFFQINTAGDIWGTDEWADAITLYGEFDWNYVPGQDEEYCSWDKPGLTTCAGHKYETGLIYQAHNAGVEIYPSIGGWTLSDPFPPMAANPEARLQFANNCVRLIESYDFDGIDIDWEYPGYADHSGTPEDTLNYNLLLGDIRNALDDLGSRTGRFYGLTAALPCGPDLINNIQIDVVSDILTELNLMTYDFMGSWNPTTGANAPLYDMDGHPEFSVHGCVENWKAGGGRPDQINLGLPFYGRSFAGAGITGFAQSHSGNADTTTWSDDEGSPQYFNIVDKLSQFTYVRDPITMTQYAYNSVGFVSYDDERAICDKCEYAMDHSLNGFIIWEISGDILRDLSTPLLDACNNKLNNPGVRCDDISDVTVQDTAVAGVATVDTTIVDTIVTVETVPVTLEDSNQVDNTDTLVDNTSTTMVEQWYPHQGFGFCVNDGMQLELYISPQHIYGSVSECCQAHYELSNIDCEYQSVYPPTGSWYLSTGYVCSSESPVPSWITNLFDSKEDCCVSSFGHSCDEPDPAEDIVNFNEDVIEQDTVAYQNYYFYPHYADGTMAECRNDGNAPSFITLDMMTKSRYECCKAYFFEDECNLDRPYYPSFEERTCLNDGNQPRWMAGDYLSKNLWECCHNSYHDEESLRHCSGIPKCDGCDVSDLSIYYETNL